MPDPSRQPDVPDPTTRLHPEPEPLDLLRLITPVADARPLVPLARPLEGIVEDAPVAVTAGRRRWSPLSLLVGAVAGAVAGAAATALVLAARHSGDEGVLDATPPG